MTAKYATKKVPYHGGRGCGFRPDAVTGEREYNEEETALLRAADQYRSDKGKQFLTVCDVLQIMKSLGYRKGRRSGRN